MITLALKKKSVFQPSFILSFRLLLKMNDSTLLHSMASVSQLFSECAGAKVCILYLETCAEEFSQLTY